MRVATVAVEEGSTMRRNDARIDVLKVFMLLTALVLVGMIAAVVLFD